MAQYHISISANRISKNRWGDLQYAEGLGRGLVALGHDVGFFFAGEYPKLTGPQDIVLRIAGPHLEEPISGATNLAWIISPPNLAPLGKLRRFDHVFFCSQALAKHFEQENVAASYLPQATETSHFHPSKADPRKPVLPVTFVGNNHDRVSRRLVFAAVAADVGLKVWGRGWEGHIPKTVFAGPYLDYDELAEVYARSRIILNSQMDRMSALGMMANRSFDALASGAEVLSDPVAHFSAPSLTNLTQIAHNSQVPEFLKMRLTQEVATLEERQARHDAVAACFDLQRSAQEIDAVARSIVERRHLSKASHAAQPPAGKEAPETVELTDYRPDAFTNSPTWRADLDRLQEMAQTRPVSVVVRLTLPEGRFDQQTETDVFLETAYAILRLSAIIAMRTCFANLTVVPPQTVPKGQIHALMADLRLCQRRLAEGSTDEAEGCDSRLTSRAHIVCDTLTDRGSVFALRTNADHQMIVLQRAMRQMPLFPHQPMGFTRDRLKHHVKLWPRQKPQPLRKPVGVFIHLFYPELAAVFAERCSRIDAPKRFYISTDTPEKRDEIALSFPDADIRLFANRGRDIYPKFFGFQDALCAHDILLHLHGKKSPHLGGLDSWLEHILDCLLPQSEEINRILSFFQSAPRLGLVGPLRFPPVLSSAHWVSNYDIARELAARMELGCPLPDDSQLRFSLGSMFWARSAALRPIYDLALAQDEFPPERGQRDGTVAHAIERLVGVVCEHGGFQQVSVAGPQSTRYRKYAQTFSRNKDLRDMLMLPKGAAV